MATELLIEKGGGGVATVTLNRPDVHNAFDERLIANLTDAFKSLDADSAVRLIVLQANGKSFCAGADLNWMKSMARFSYEENYQDSLGLAEMFYTIHSCNKPTIAKVQGAAFGGGVGLVVCCDIAIASEKATFCLSEVKLGLIPATISPYVIKAVGGRLARHLFLTADVLTAKTAFENRLITQVVRAEFLDEQFDKHVSKLLKNGPEALKAAKQLVNDYEYQCIDRQLIENSCNRIAEIRVSPEGQEGLASFLEKRLPSWINSSQ